MKQKQRKKANKKLPKNKEGLKKQNNKEGTKKMWKGEVNEAKEKEREKLRNEQK